MQDWSLASDDGRLERIIMKKGFNFIIAPRDGGKPARRIVIMPTPPPKIRPVVLTSVEFERLYKFFENVFERECPGHSEQVVHAYVMVLIETIKSARELKALKDQRVKEINKSYQGRFVYQKGESETLSNWGGW